MFAHTETQAQISVEPSPRHWTEAPSVAARSQLLVHELLRRTDNPAHEHYLAAWDSRPASVAAEIDELKTLAARRQVQLPAGTVSTLLAARPQPVGAVVAKRRPTSPVLQTGEDLARWFEAEAPGLAHRHALQQLLPATGWSSAQRGTVWAALDLAVETAVLAAWHYKWTTNRGDVRYRPRPIVVDPGLCVLYDTVPSPDAYRVAGGRPLPSTPSGTPFHPAYPSGHSTIGAAASEVLAFFFPREAVELRKIAENAGTARLWAGVNYPSDHAAGLALGRAVASLVIEQLQSDGVRVTAASAPSRTLPSRVDSALAWLAARVLPQDGDALPLLR